MHHAHTAGASICICIGNCRKDENRKLPSLTQYLLVPTDTLHWAYGRSGHGIATDCIGLWRIPVLGYIPVCRWTIPADCWGFRGIRVHLVRILSVAYNSTHTLKTGAVNSPQFRALAHGPDYVRISIYIRLYLRNDVRIRILILHSTSSLNYSRSQACTSTNSIATVLTVL